MPWQDLHEDLLEEFGTYSQSYDGDNLWLEQASAAREYDRERNARAKREKKEVGECLDCRSPALSNMVRCAQHREEHNAKARERERERERRERVSALDQAKQVIAIRAAARKAEWMERNKRAFEARLAGFRKYREEQNT